MLQERLKTPLPSLISGQGSPTWIGKVEMCVLHSVVSGFLVCTYPWCPPLGGGDSSNVISTAPSRPQNPFPGYTTRVRSSLSLSPDFSVTALALAHREALVRERKLQAGTAPYNNNNGCKSKKRGEEEEEEGEATKLLFGKR